MKKIISYLLKAVEHIIVILASVALTFSVVKLLKHWEHPVVLGQIKRISLLLDIPYYLYTLEGIFGVLIFCYVTFMYEIFKNYTKGKTAIKAGMVYYCQNTSAKKIKKSEKFLRKKSLKTTQIHILAASGWDTFGSQDSPLYDAIDRCNRVEVILFNPLSCNLIKRSKDIDVRVSDYRSKVYKSIERLSELRKGLDKGRIELKMYYGYPSCKLIIMDQAVWVQQYPSDSIVRESLSYAYTSFQDCKEIKPYDQFFSMFQSRWDSIKLGKYNFENNKLEFFDESKKKVREVEMTNKRSEERIMYNETAQYVSDDKRVKAVVNNLSKHGLSVTVYPEKGLNLNRNSLCKILFPITGDNVIELICKVKRIFGNLPHSPAASLGLQIDNPPLEYKNYINILS